MGQRQYKNVVLPVWGSNYKDKTVMRPGGGGGGGGGAFNINQPLSIYALLYNDILSLESESLYMESRLKC